MGKPNYEARAEMIDAYVRLEMIRLVVKRETNHIRRIKSIMMILGGEYAEPDGRVRSTKELSALDDWLTKNVGISTLKAYNRAVENDKAIIGPNLADIQNEVGKVLAKMAKGAEK